MTANKKEIKRHALFLLPPYLLMFTSGCVYGWVPQAIYKLQHGKSHIRATSRQCSWVASITSLGQVLSAIPAGILMDKFGKRNVTVASGLLFALCWLAKCHITSIGWLLVIRFITGISSGTSSTVAPAYIAEVSSAKIRGAALAIEGLIYTVGMLFEIVLLKYLSFSVSAIVTLAFPLLFLVSLRWLAPSPNDLVAKRKYQKARETLKWLRNGESVDVINKECASMESYVECETAKDKIKFFDAMKDSHNRNRLIVAAGLNSAYVMAGRSAIFTYLSFLVPSNEWFNSDDLPAIVTILTMIASLLSPLIIDRFDRKKFFCMPCLISSIPMAIAGTVYYLDSETDIRVPALPWILLACLSVDTFIEALCMSPALFALRGELLPHSVKGIGSGIGIVSSSITSFLMIHVFRILHVRFGLHFNFWMASIVNILLAAYVYNFIPETNKKLLSEIQMSNKKQDTTLNSNEDLCTKF